METSINKATEVEYELEIKASAEDLEPKLQSALRAQRSQMDVKGFRKGKVPMELVKKMHGQAIGYKVAEQYVQEIFERELSERDDIDVLGQPTLTQLDYEIDGDLEAVIRFGIRPEVELKDLSDEQITVLKHDVGDDDVEEEIERLLVREADLVPIDEDEEADEEDFVNLDMQRMDPSTDTPIIGDKDEDISFFLDDRRLREELRDAIIGKKAGDTFRVTLPGAEEGQGEGDSGPRMYQVTLKDVKRRELPPFDEELVRSVTDGQYEDPQTFRDEIEHRLQHAWENRSRELMQNEVVERMLELHPVPVPQPVVEMYLDSFVNQVKEQNDGELPDGFDHQLFRQQNAADAEKQGRWMLIRDKVIEEANLEATDEDLTAFFEEQAHGEQQVTAQQIEQFYRSMPRMMERVRQQVLSRKVYDHLLESFDTQELEREAFEEEMESRQPQAQQPAPGAAPETEQETDAPKITGVRS